MHLARVYADPTKRLAHLVPVSSFDNPRGISNHPSKCGRAYPWSRKRGWLGRASVNEINEASTLPLCKICGRNEDVTA